MQASMIWLDICGFCGYKRKMEVAESNLQPLVTALRRSGKFDKVGYETMVRETTRSLCYWHALALTSYFVTGAISR
jgi:hypothetical protein